MELKKVGSITCRFKSNPAPEKATFTGNRYTYDTNLPDYSGNLEREGWAASLELVSYFFGSCFTPLQQKILHVN